MIWGVLSTKQIGNHSTKERLGVHWSQLKVQPAPLKMQSTPGAGARELANWRCYRGRVSSGQRMVAPQNGRWPAAGFCPGGRCCHPIKSWPKGWQARASWWGGVHGEPQWV